jgi:hypothetical protein
MDISIANLEMFTEALRMQFNNLRESLREHRKKANKV